MKLSDETKAEGRALVTTGDLEKLMSWVREHSPVGLDHALYEQTMRKCFVAQDFARAIHCHNAVFDTYDAAVERARIVLARALGCGLVLAVLGGLGALIAGVVALVRFAFS